MTIEEMEKAVRESKDKLRAVKKQRDDELDAAQREINARWQPALDEAARQVNLAERHLREAVSATATHPWEGKRVVGHKWVTSGFSGRHETAYGIVEVRRVDTLFADNLASYKRPAIGEAFVRLLKKDGTPGMKIDTNLNAGKLEEDCNGD